MKIMKNILIPIVLFISLFFNTSTIFAANNLNTTFNANNDELTVTVKNNSDKELSDVEYNLNLPSEYTAKYEVNPNYSLSPQEKTTFKVKVSKSGDNVLNNGEQGTKTFTSSKKSLDNTGLTSELTVGAVVVLFLLVGVLLYFKQRKVFIILLMAGLGTQLTPRYSFAADKIRQTENFKEHVTLLKNNIPVSLDVSYLIDGDSNNNGNNSGNNGNITNNNGNNSGNNGLNPNDKNPKEILVAGYAYSGKTNNILEEKELKVFDGDKEIATVKTDAEGYFFTHLIQDKTYTIKGEDFEVTVTAKNTGDYEHKDVVGKLTLGRELKDENTYIKVKPSVAYINEDIEYKVEGDKVTIEGERELKTGDKLILAPSHTYLTGFAFIINTVSITDGKTVLTVTPITSLDSIVDDFKYNEEIDLSRMKFEPAKGWKVVNDNKMEPNGYSNRSIFDGKYQGESKGTLKLVKDFKDDKDDKDDKDANIKKNDLFPKLEVELGASIKYDISLSDKKAVVDPSLSLKITGKIEKQLFNPKYSEFEFFKEPINLGKSKYVTWFGVSMDVEFNLIFKIDGSVGIESTFDITGGAKLGYDKKGILEPYSNLNMKVNLKGEGSAFAGGKLKFPSKFLYSIELVKVEMLMGPKIKGEFGGDFGLLYNDQKFNFYGTKLEGVISLAYIVKGEPVFLNKFIKDIKLEKELEIELYKLENGKDEKEKEKTNDEKLKPYWRVFEDFKKIRENKDNKQKLYSIKLNEYWNPWVLESVAESNDVSYALYDIDKDGTDELLISTNKGKNLISSFYLDNGNPRLLVEDYVARHGGGRAVSNIYTDGSILHRTWLSGTGKGNAELFKFTNGKLIKMKSLPIDNILTFDLKNMDVSNKAELNLNSLEWKLVKADL